MNTEHSNTVNAAPLWDVDGALERLGGRTALLEKIVNIYIESAPKTLAELKTAEANQDASKIKSTAHTLKGISAGIGATEVESLARQLEHFDYQDSAIEASELINILQIKMSSVIGTLKKWLAKKNTSS